MVFGSNKTKGLTQTAKISYGRLCLMEIMKGNTGFLSVSKFEY